MEIVVKTRRYSPKRLLRLVREVMPAGVPENAVLTFLSARFRVGAVSYTGGRGLTMRAYSTAKVWVPFADIPEVYGWGPRAAARGYFRIEIRTRDEAVLLIAAHELKHLTQRDRPSSPSLETEADDWAQACLAAYRRGEIVF